MLIFLFVATISFHNLQAQNINVSGIIVDPSGTAIEGAGIVEKGSTNGTVSDQQGHFTVSVDANSTLVISLIGYETQEVKINNRSNLTITLREDTELLNEIVVVGYATQRKATVAAAVSSVNNTELSRNSFTSTANALVGKVSGITARQKSGVPGSSTTIQIRNMGTPLYVIDGIMRDAASFNALDVNDIENISILKDGAAAIYGVKAANGVILVTTKTGKEGQKAQININAYTGFQRWTKYPKLLNAYQWKWGNYMKQVNDGNLTGEENIANAKAELEKWRTKYYNPETGEDYRGYDWKGNFVSDHAPQSYINANISGGSNNSDYYLSIGHVDQDAVFKDYNYNRTNLQGNFNMRLTDNLKVGFGVNGKIEQNVNPALPGSDDYFQMCNSVFNLIPTMRPYANDNEDYLNYIHPTHDGARNMAAYTIENAGKHDAKFQTISLSGNIEYKTPLPGLTGKALFSYYFENYHATDNEKSWNEYSYDATTQEYQIASTKTSTYRGDIRNNRSEINGQLTLNYDHVFNNIHHVTGVAGFEFYKEDRKNMNIWQNPVENQFVELINTNENNNVSNTIRKITTASFIFRAGYSFKDKYIIDFAGRYDASWRFQPGDQWGFFPSISGAWRLSEEDFYKNSPINDWMSSVKLRASYGEMGDDMASTFNSLYPDFAYMAGYTFNNGGSIISENPLGNGGSSFVTGTVYNGIPQTGLTWMKIKMANIGADFGFFKDRLNAEIDFFRRKRTGIPATPTDIIYPYEAGYSALKENLNSDQISGIDGMIRWHDNIQDFSYYIGVNLTLARQKTLDNYGETFLNAWDKYRWGQSNRWSNVKHDAVWMWETIGVFKTQEEIDNYPVNIDGANNVNLKPGDLIFKDVNGDGLIDEYDLRPLGYASTDYAWDSSNSNKNPLLSMGINIGFEYKGIDVAADFAGGFMNTFVGDWHVKYGIGTDQMGYVYNVIDSWQHEDIFDPTSPWKEGSFPAVRSNNPSIRWWNDFYAKEINYLRLRNLTIGYTLPINWTQKVLIKKLRVYFNGSNLLCWDSLHKFGFDPEISSVTGFDYPQHKVILFGINLTF